MVFLYSVVVIVPSSFTCHINKTGFEIYGLSPLLGRDVGAVGSWPPKILVDQLTLSQPGGADYVHHITKCPPPLISRPSYGPA